MNRLKILIITDLYPGYKGQSRREITYALHEIYRYIEEYYSIKVIRLWRYFPKIFNIFKRSREKSKYAYREKIDIEGIQVERIPILAIPYLRIGIKQKKYVSKYIIEMCKCENINPDIVLCHTVEPSLEIGRYVSKYFNVPLVIILHNCDLRIIKNNYRIKKYISECNGIVFRSQKIQKYANRYLIENNYYIKEQKQYLLQSSIEVNKIIDQESLIKKINKRNLNFIIVSNLDSKDKMVDRVIKAYLKMDKIDTTLSIIGEGRLRPSLEKISYGRKDIKYYGSLENEITLKMMQDADVFALISKNETFGLVYIEAMSKGCIVIGSKGEGIDGYIIDNKNGFLCEPGNIEELNMLFLKCYNMNLEDKKRILKNSINTIVNNSKEKIINEYKKYLKKIIMGIKSK